MDKPRSFTLPTLASGAALAHGCSQGPRQASIPTPTANTQPKPGNTDPATRLRVITSAPRMI